MIQSSLLSQDEEVRLSGLQSLYRYHGPERFDSVCAALGDSSWRIRKEAVNLFLSLPEAEGSVERIVNLLYDDENAGLRNAAAEILVKLKGAVLPVLLRAVDTPDHDVRKFILDILGDIGDRRATSLLLSLLKSDPETNVRAAAAENLGKIGDNSAVDAMLDAMAEPDLLVQFSLLEALARIGSPVAADRLLGLSRNNLLRKPLFDALGRIGDETAVTTLLAGLRDPMRNVREAAALALQNLLVRYDSQLLSGRLTPEILAGVEKLLSSPALNVQKAALSLLGQGDDLASLQLFASYLDHEVYADDVAAILAKRGESAVVRLLPCWEGASEKMKAYLSYLFAVTGVESARPLLVSELKDADDFLRAVILRSLGQIGAEDDIGNIAGYLEVPETEVRQAAVDGLIKVAERFHAPVIDLVRELFQHSDPEVRQAALQVLGRLGGSEAEAVLLLAMKDESPLVRRSAISSLDGCNPHHSPALTLALTDEESDVRRQAVEALALSADRSLIEPLLLILDDEDPWVRATTIRALGRFGGDVALNALHRGLRDPVGLVTIAALETMRQENIPLPSKDLEEELEHKDDDVVLTLLQMLEYSPDTTWLDRWAERLLCHRHNLVRQRIAELLAHKGGETAGSLLQHRLLIEESEEIRQFIRQILDAFPVTPESR